MSGWEITFLKVVIWVVLMIIGGAVHRYFIARRTPHRLPDDSHMIQPSRLLIISTLMIFLSASLGCLWMSWSSQHNRLDPMMPQFGPDAWWQWGLAGCVSFLLGVSTLTSLNRRYQLTWNQIALKGPTSNGFPPFGPTVGVIYYDDLVDYGTDGWGQFFVEDHVGTRVRWSQMYQDYEEPMEVIGKARPDLFDDCDD